MFSQPIVFAALGLQICKFAFLSCAVAAPQCQDKHGSRFLCSHQAVRQALDSPKSALSSVSNMSAAPTPSYVLIPVLPASPLSSLLEIPIDSAPSPSPTTWKSPLAFDDLSAFTVTHFAAGKDNFAIVTATAVVATPTPPTPGSEIDSSSEKPLLGSVIQLLYPKDSFSPSNRPQGGAEFYASPLDLSTASNVTLEYDVYFPEGFDFVKGGKLPGLFGGHETCSGGNAAVDCFSTRLMWRANGMGELYLYAPKDKQTKALCSLPPKSICSTVDGLSIARGSFSFTPGAWTHLAQTVALNTPGEQDGGFSLQVDGSLVIDRRDVYYRNKAALPSPKKSSSSNSGDFLSGLLGALGALSVPQSQYNSSEYKPSAFSAINTAIQKQVIYAQESRSSKASVGGGEDSLPPIGFAGLFFSTFFGGSGHEWASPRDQYVWFAGFSMQING